MFINDDERKPEAEETESDGEEREDLTLDDVEEVDGGEPGDGKAEPKEADKAEQTKEERARQAEARRKREAKERQAKEKEIADKAYLRGQLDSTRVNPYTNKPVKDEYDLKVLRVQRQIEDEGDDPITDLPAKLAELDREEASKRADEAKKAAESDKAIEDDIADFRGKHPGVDPKEILSDARFAAFSRGKLGSERLSDIYDEFSKTFGDLGKKETDGRKKGTAPSPNGGQKREAPSYSKMTEEQKIAYLKKEGMI